MKKTWKLVANKTNKFQPTIRIKRYSVGNIEFLDKVKTIVDRNEKDLVKDITHLMGDGSPIPF